jgi:hypothetical protein
MRVFNKRNFSPPRTEVAESSKVNKRTQQREVIPGKRPPSKSSSEIRARVEELRKESQAKKFEHAKKMREKRLQGNSYMNAEVANKSIPKPPSQADLAAKVESNKKTLKEVGTGEHVDGGAGHLLNSDITQNDPTAPETQEKLKKVISTGAFSFNEKERAVLEKILGQEGP